MNKFEKFFWISAFFAVVILLAFFSLAQVFFICGALAVAVCLTAAIVAYRRKDSKAARAFLVAGFLGAALLSLVCWKSIRCPTPTQKVGVSLWA